MFRALLAGGVALVFVMASMAADQPDLMGKITKIDTDKNTLSVNIVKEGKPKAGKPEQRTIEIKKGVTIKLGPEEEDVGKLTDLKVGDLVQLRQKKGQVVEIFKLRMGGGGGRPPRTR
jgi:hypothetical protein